MKHLIDKDTLVAEIERRLNYRVKSLKAINDGTFWDEDQSEDDFNKVLTRCAFNAAKNELFELKCLLDTLEVEEVDLDYIKDELDRVVKIYKPDGDFGWGTLYNIATHFFELGLKAQKGE